MASWMVHLRVADKLLDKLGGITEREFVVGNIAPDSGVPNADWSVYTPNGEQTHFKRPSGRGGMLVNEESIADFVSQYFTKEMQRGYDKEAYSFYLGYLVHLLTDILWTDLVYRPGVINHPEEYEADKKKLLWDMKKDWYDLDFLYLKKHPDFRAFCIYEQAVGFENQYMDIFAQDAFDNRREYITGWYRAGREGLEREYPYFTEVEAEAFVDNAVVEILGKLQENYDE